MGKEFGKLTRIVGITYYTLSQHEQRAFAGAFGQGLKNVLRRTRESFFMFAIPTLIGVATVYTFTDIYEKSLRKNPDDYKNDT